MMSSSDSDASTYVINSDCLFEEEDPVPSSQKPKMKKRKRSDQGLGHKKTIQTDPLFAVVEDGPPQQPSTSTANMGHLTPKSEPTNSTAGPSHAAGGPPIKKRRKYVRKQKKIVVGASSVLNETQVLQSVKAAMAHTPLIILPVYMRKKVPGAKGSAASKDDGE